MAEAQANQAPSLSEQYLLEKNEKQDTSAKSAEVKEVAAPVTTPAEETLTDQSKETPTAVESTPTVAAEDSAPVIATEESTEAPAVSEGSTEAPPATEESTEEAPPAAGENNDENPGEQEDVVEETPEIKIETVPADFRFPTTNQTRHCFTRYIEYHRCVAAKGDGAPECDKFAKYYRSLCPSEWIERWNEQRENGTFPGPL